MTVSHYSMARSLFLLATLLPRVSALTLHCSTPSHKPLIGTLEGGLSLPYSSARVMFTGPQVGEEETEAGQSRGA